MATFATQVVTSNTPLTRSTEDSATEDTSVLEELRNHAPVELTKTREVKASVSSVQRVTTVRTLDQES
jgi:hypothetical protein